MSIIYPALVLSPEFLQGIDCAPDASVVVGESGTILYANQQVTQLLGYSLGEIYGQSVELLMPERFRLSHIGHRLRFTDDRRTRPLGAGRQLFVLCKDGSERPVEISLSPVQRGLETLVVAVIRDVTERAAG
jgi:PAS domain S-box-containing protein